VRDHEDGAAITAVRDHPAVQSEDEHGYKAEQAQQTEFQRISGKLEDLPGNGYGLDLRSEYGYRIGRPQQAEVTMPERLERE